ncbi:MAG: NAD(P)/FAD-dependent oxidoreductase [Acidobacteriota bacterium]|nr:NAD(P)/FAD-dependent oxidoreductase [Acidobacteriota bacterium]
MDECDVLIVGGGPAGSSCAWALRNSGLDVVILDQHIFPRDKICGGWITPAVLEQLEIDPSEYASQHLLQPITSFRVGRIGGRAVETAYGKPVSYGIRRREFDHYLLKRSTARLLLGKPLTSLTRTAHHWLANNQIRAGIVIGAGGHFCPVARLVGNKKPAEPAVVAQEIEFEMDPAQQSACRVQSEMPELYFCSDMKGYGWCFRKGSVMNIGLGRADPHTLTAYVADFLRFLKSTGRIAFDVPPMRGHAYLLQGTSTRTIVGDGVLLIGDAAGLAYPQSGEGIRPAVDSGLSAANDIRANRLSAYSTHKPQPWRHIPTAIITPAARLLLTTHWFVRNVVLNTWFLNRDGA